MSIHNTQKLPFLLRVKKHECSFAYQQSLQHNTNNTKLLCKVGRKCPTN